MAIWNCTDDENDIARMLQMALPNVDTDAEMLALDPEKLKAAAQMADSFTDSFLAQQAALAELIAHADLVAIGRKDTLRHAGFLLSTLTELHELTRRIASSAYAYSDPETRALYQAMARGDGVEVARLMQ